MQQTHRKLQYSYNDYKKSRTAMNSTSTLFHRNVENTISNVNCLKQFLEGFPEADFWRFFVERSLYDLRRILFDDFYSSLIKTSPDEVNPPLEIIENAIKEKNLTIGDIYSLAEKHQNTSLLKELNDVYHLGNRKNEKIFDYMSRHQAWIGFEEKEPGYLIHVTSGLKFILTNLINKEKFNLYFIKELHKICTSNVKNMVPETIPGGFRKCGASWPMSEDYDSVDGLTETLLYLKSVEESYGITGLTLNITETNSSNSIPINTFSSKTREQLQNGVAEQLWNSFKSGVVYVKFFAEEDSHRFIHIDSNEFLENISNKLINDLECGLSEAISKEQKLTAIFTYLKRAVLHHIFADGVGRTFSMLLLQYLLLRENLLPVLIIDSNIIPGKSVKELVNEYYRAEKEMSIILNDPAYINSEKFSDLNVNTENLYTKLDQSDKNVFDASLNVYREAKELCLSMMRRSVLTM